MKKIFILFLLTASLGFSVNYKVEVKPNVKIQKSEIEKNNIEIEKKFFENTKEDISFIPIEISSFGIKEIDSLFACQFLLFQKKIFLLE